MWNTTLIAASAALAATLVAPASAATTRGAGFPIVKAPLQAAHGRTAQTAYTFTTLDDQADPTFNQLLGINNSGEISGYFGSGVAGHPNQGYTILSPYAQTNYTNENFPGSAQTQVTGLNNLGDTCGFWVDGKGNNFGFIEWNGVFTSYKDPHTGKGTTNQILGINDRGFAVGFYVGVKGDSHAFRLNQATGKFESINPPGGKNAVATGISAHGDITGFLTSSTGVTEGFLLKGRTFTEFTFPGSGNTMPFGVNAQDEIVGAYTDASGGSHGFVLTSPLMHASFQSLDNPNGVGTTLLNGLNDAGDLVGFYTDAAGNTDGFLAQP
jgi:hypothetical protein